ncbi:hypothetical protein H4R34_000062 [Dimargaris verticillata]|uniref:Radical SAM core domain-containing protein n=1 Tax=Dimargaris verticillata TaxID=2761393 RepID=A0A9W8EBQ8_9FUNG|nr:hypothetical protein H4R34_000062 [Dimargaris verticillata]
MFPSLAWLHYCNDCQRGQRLTRRTFAATRAPQVNGGPLVDLLGLPYPELLQRLAAYDERLPKYRARQLWQALYREGIASLAEVTTLPVSLRSTLASKFQARSCAVKTAQVSALDQTTKFLVHLGTPQLGKNAHQDSQQSVEAVLIPEGARQTLCVSSQIGCSLACTFCHTGTQRLLRNLSAAEIVGQVMLALEHCREFPIIPNQQRRLKNIVFMGQGEPLYNYRQVRPAIQVLTDPDGLAFRPDRITVSTSGVAPLIPKLATDLGITLAVSLHAVNDALRDKLVPLNRTYPLAVLLKACESFAKHASPRNSRITFEYVMLKGVNDSLGEAATLARLVSHLPAHINLIQFECSPVAQIEAFAQTLKSKNVYTSVRWSKGQDILAACGQLRSNELLKGAATAS